MKKSPLLLLALMSSALVGCFGGGPNAVEINDSAIPSYLVPGETLTIRASAGSSNGEGNPITVDSKAKVTYSVSAVGDDLEAATDVATIDETGKITAVKEGEFQVNAFLDGNKGIFDSVEMLVKDHYTTAGSAIMMAILGEELPFYKGLDVEEALDTFSQGFATYVFYAENDEQIFEIDDLFQKFFTAKQYVYQPEVSGFLAIGGVLPSTDRLYLYDKTIVGEGETNSLKTIVTIPVRKIDAHVSALFNTLEAYPAYYVQIATEEVLKNPETTSGYTVEEKAIIKDNLKIDLPYYGTGSEVALISEEPGLAGAIASLFGINVSSNAIVVITDASPENQAAYVAALVAQGFESVNQAVSIYEETTDLYSLQVVAYNLMSTLLGGFIFDRLAYEVVIPTDVPDVTLANLSAEQIAVVTQAVGAGNEAAIVLHDELKDIVPTLIEGYSAGSVLPAVSFNVPLSASQTTAFFKDYLALALDSGLYDVYSSDYETFFVSLESVGAVTIDGRTYTLNIDVERVGARNVIITYYTFGALGADNGLLVEDLLNELIRQNAEKYGLEFDVTDDRFEINAPLTTLFTNSATINTMITSPNLVEAAATNLPSDVNTAGKFTAVLGADAEEFLFDHDEDALDTDGEPNPSATDEVIEGVQYVTSVNLSNTDGTKTGVADIYVEFNFVYGQSANLLGIEIGAGVIVSVNGAIPADALEAVFEGYELAGYDVDSYGYTLNNGTLNITYTDATYTGLYVDQLLALEGAYDSSLCYLYGTSTDETTTTTTHQIVVDTNDTNLITLQIRQTHDTATGLGSISISIARSIIKTFDVAYAWAAYYLDSHLELPTAVGAEYYEFEYDRQNADGYIYCRYTSEENAIAALEAYHDALLAAGFEYDDENYVYTTEAGVTYPNDIAVQLFYTTTTYELIIVVSLVE